MFYARGSLLGCTIVDSVALPLTVVETRVSLSVHYQILPLSKYQSALIHRTSLAHPGASIFIFADFMRVSTSSARLTTRLIVHFLMLYPFV
jgi:hypothetical protein